MKINLESTFSISNDNLFMSKYDDIMLNYIHTKIQLKSSDDLSEVEDDEYIDIGYMNIYSFDLDYDHDNLILLADCISSDNHLYNFAKLILSPDSNLDHSYRNLFYIDRVFIKPEYRGNDYGLKSLGIFLQKFGREQTVGCYPHPLDMSKNYSDEKKRFLMMKYWSKVGLTEYIEEYNILWVSVWFLPQWLKKTIFDFEEEWDFSVYE